MDFDTLYVAFEVVETLTKRCVDIGCVQESRGKGASARLVTGKDNVFKNVS